MADKGAGRQQLTTSPTSGKNYLLVIAIDSYAHCPKLHNCVKDAEAITVILQEKYQFGKADTTTLLNEKATRKNILRELRNLHQKVTPNDNLLLLFSGHGDNRHGVGYWIPVEAEPNEEAEFISTSDIINYLNVINSLHTFVIVDACFSGSLFSYTRDIKRTDYQRPSRWGLAASHSKEVAVDGTPGDNSPFADRLLFKLKHSSEALNVQELSNFITDEVQRLTNGKQTPVSRPLNVKGDELGQFAFLPKKDETQDWAEAQEVNTVAAYQKYLDNYRAGKFQAIASQRILELKEEEAWLQAKSRQSISSYLTYLHHYPAGHYADAAKKAVATLEEDKSWKTALRQQTLSGYYTYKDKYPYGEYAAEADQRIKLLQDEYREDEVWQATTANTKESYEFYLKEYPTGKHAATARRKLAEFSSAAQPKPRVIEKEQPKPQQLISQKQNFPNRWIGLGVLLVALVIIIGIWQPWKASEDLGDVVIFQEGDKYGLKSERGKILAPAQYAEIKTPTEGFFAANLNDNFGYLDAKGQTAIDFKFKNAMPFSEGLAAVWNGQAFGYINKKGELVIDYQFQQANDFSAGMAAVSQDRDVWGYIDTSGTLKLDYQYTSAPAFGKSDGLVWVEIGEKNFLIDRTGKCLDGDCPDAPLSPKYIEPEMVFVKGGTFTMGCKEGRDKDCRGDEKPAHDVTLSDFHIGKYEVTFKEYDAYCEATGKAKPNDEGWGRGKRPVINVSWEDATAYCKWLNQQTGKNYRLPTEAEWEYAARGGNKSKGYTYAGSNNLNEVAWYNNNSNRQTHPVGQKKANELEELYDMSGNVYEWCQDWYGSYTADAATNPKGPASGQSRVVRGGSWFNDDFICRVSDRNSWSTDYRNDYIGFRLAW